MKATRVSFDTVIVVVTFPLWAPALLVGILCGIIKVGFIRGMRLIVDE
jgi:hypothetical protein